MYDGLQTLAAIDSQRVWILALRAGDDIKTEAVGRNSPFLTAPQRTLDDVEGVGRLVQRPQAAQPA